MDLRTYNSHPESSWSYPSLQEWRRIFPASCWFNIDFRTLPRIFQQTVDNMGKFIQSMAFCPHVGNSSNMGTTWLFYSVHTSMTEMKNYGERGLATRDKIIQLVPKELQLKLEDSFPYKPWQPESDNSSEEYAHWNFALFPNNVNDHVGKRVK